MDQPLPPTSASLGWRREGFELALIGPEAMRHKELLVRAGYQVRGAKDGDRAQTLFAGERAVDVIVLDFGLQGRPPEAVLLFSRGSSEGAQIVGLVPAQDADSFRRAFLAGARDVLPVPARGEDLLASVDYLLEPRALQAAVERLQVQLEKAATQGPDGASPPEVAELRQEVERVRERQRADLVRFEEELKAARVERDRLLESQRSAKKKLAHARLETRDGAAQLRLLEKACEELQKKLKDARDERRLVDQKLKGHKRRIQDLEEAMHRYVAAAELEVMGVTEMVEALPPASQSQVDPEEALAARAEDERRLSALEAVLEEKAQLERRVASLEAQLALPSGALEVTRADVEISAELEDALERRAADERRLEELDEALASRGKLEREAGRLSADLAERRRPPGAFGADSASELAAELDDLKDSYAEAKALLEAVRKERGTLQRRVAELERDAADALMRVEELTPLLGENERLRAELRAEREAHTESKRTFGRATSRFSVLDKTALVLEDELGAKSRALILAHARNDAAQAELSNLRASLLSAKEAREHSLAQLREAERELEDLRSTVAGLAAERAHPVLGRSTLSPAESFSGPGGSEG